MTEAEFIAFAKTSSLGDDEELCLRVHLGLKHNQEEWAEFESQHQALKNRTLWAALCKLPKKKERPSA